MPLIASRAGGSATSFGGLGASVVAPAGTYESVATSIVSGTSTTSVTFSGISQVFAHLQIRFYLPTVPTELRARFNGDAGNNYTRTGMFADTGGFGTFNDLTANYADLVVDSTVGATGIFDILDYTTSKYKSTRGISGRSASGHYVIALRGTTWNNNSPITSITFDYNTGSFANNSHIALYGIRGA